ncbi:MAG: endopeptidase La [Saprospiraceae bacterium]|jgi:ATP-dependent Lon protease
MFEEWLFPHNLNDESDFMPIMSLDEEDENETQESMPDQLPILVLRNTVLFPGLVIPITIGREKSLKAVDNAYHSNRLIAVLAQQDSDNEDPGVEDLFTVGTIARIIKLLRMPDGTVTAILQGRKRFTLGAILSEDPFLLGETRPLEYLPVKNPVEFEAIIASIRDMAKQIIELSPNIPDEAVVMLRNISKNAFLLNFISSNLRIDVRRKQKILEMSDLYQKAEVVFEHVGKELQMLEIRDQIETKVRGDIERQQRDYFLNQQLKTIQEELGQNPQEEELEELAARAKKKKWPESARDIFEKELNRARRTNPQMAEYSILLNYLELLLDLPWDKYTKDNFDLRKVQQVLDRDHYGLEKVKERIVEHLAVLKLKQDMKAPIICLVGPPGVGKTSLGRSIAKALNRKFIRMSLGGLHDESEVRGHRRTYIGAMPGRIIQSIKKAGSSNPVFILDEIDKVGRDFRGDPSSALLEVLDPEQNTHFYDNYLEMEYDLSKVLFIATANSLAPIQSALLDRMEVIHLEGYSTEEKLEIAKHHLIPRQRTEHGLKGNQIRLRKDVVRALIEDYTRESGVRSLDRVIAAVMRHAAKKVALEEAQSLSVKKEELTDILGPSKFDLELYREKQAPGVAIGLAWTSVGGDILFIESSLSKGSGKLTLTGNLGDVMKESATTALSYIKAHSDEIGIDPEAFGKSDIHIHVPQGAIPKDGPSAGITMLTALASVFRNKPLKPHLAMTGEITLRGKVLPVGGIKEKILAARRAGLKEIILCKDNEKQILEIEQNYLKGLTFHYVTTMKEVLSIALGL